MKQRKRERTIGGIKREREFFLPGVQVTLTLKTDPMVKKTLNNLTVEKKSQCLNSDWT